MIARVWMCGCVSACVRVCIYVCIHVCVRVLMMRQVLNSVVCCTCKNVPPSTFAPGVQPQPPARQSPPHPPLSSYLLHPLPPHTAPLPRPRPRACRSTLHTHLTLPRAALPPADPAQPACLLLDVLVALGTPDTWAAALPLAQALPQAQPAHSGQPTPRAAVGLSSAIMGCLVEQVGVGRGGVEACGNAIMNCLVVEQVSVVVGGKGRAWGVARHGVSTRG